MDKGGVQWWRMNVSLERGGFLSINVSVCLCVIVSKVCFAFRFALESLGKGGMEERKVTVHEF